MVQGKDSQRPIKGFPRQDGIPLCFEEIKSGGVKKDSRDRMGFLYAWCDISSGGIKRIPTTALAHNCSATIQHHTLRRYLLGPQICMFITGGKKQYISTLAIGSQFTK